MQEDYEMKANAAALLSRRLQELENRGVKRCKKPSMKLRSSEHQVLELELQLSFKKLMSSDTSN